LRFHVLGPVRVFDDLRGELALSRPTLRHLLVALLLQANQVISPGRLAGLLWEDARADRIPELRTLICSLRTFPALSQRLGTVPGGYQLEVRPGELDLEWFRLLAGQGRDALAEGRYREAARLLGRSLELWEDPPLADLPETETMQWPAAELLEERYAARLDMAEAMLALGRHRALVPHLLAQAGQRPGDERAWEVLMLALYRSGRRADALDAFQAIARTLRDEYGIDPGQCLRQLHQDILHDRVPGPRDETPPGPAPGTQPRDETPDAEPGRPCQVCGQPVATAATGRPRSYCSRACQARAYRARKQAGLSGGFCTTLPRPP
jgi:DNA-binding SARP family transcriptional activator